MEMDVRYVDPVDDRRRGRGLVVALGVGVTVLYAAASVVLGEAAPWRRVETGLDLALATWWVVMLGGAVAGWRRRTVARRVLRRGRW
jgi:hypothetical protein